MTLTLLLSFLHSTALLRISLLLILLLNTFLLVIIQLLTEKTIVRGGRDCFDCVSRDI